MFAPCPGDCKESAESRAARLRCHTVRHAAPEEAFEELALPFPLPLLMFVAALLAPPSYAAAAPLVHHELKVALDPAHGRIEATDTVRLPPELRSAGGTVSFMLHAGLAPHALEPDVRLERVGPVRGHPALERFQVRLPAGRESFTLRYGGPLSYPRLPAARGAQTLGPISAAGVQLDGASYWYPVFGEESISFALAVQLPAGWRSMSQGLPRREERPDGAAVEHWQEQRPQRDIVLVAGPLHAYRDESGAVLAMALLREPDEALARRYLGVTNEYIDLYSRLIGPYPYEKFAAVEHFWESGLGMPSFTLLGSRVIRMPFILHTSYPHEILHNWWGNGVYIDYETGNWGEGLTSYLADHLLRERAGEGAAHRRHALQRYTNYVTGQRDFPLTAFRARHSEVAQAVGYDKTLMFFHMLRMRLGDETFVEGLRELYRSNLFRRATFEDVRRAFERASGTDLAGEFAQWVERPGAPLLQVGEVRTLPAEGGFRLTAVLEQAQGGKPYRLLIPLGVQLDEHEAVWETRVNMDGRRLTLDLELPARPWRLYVDPRFDLMRRLDRREIPPALSQMFGAERVLIVLPSQAPAPLREAYRALAQGWSATGAIELRWDRELDALPAGRAVWLLGWENRFRSRLDAHLAQQDASVTDAGATLAGQALQRAEHGIVLVVRHPHDPAHALAWLAYDRLEGLPGLARKIRHYGSYSFLAFTGDEPDNLLQGRWPVVDSPLWVTVAQPDGAEPPRRHAIVPPRPALSDVLGDPPQ
jgi:aminopeptidase N